MGADDETAAGIASSSTTRPSAGALEASNEAFSVGSRFGMVNEPRLFVLRDVDIALEP